MRRTTVSTLLLVCACAFVATQFATAATIAPLLSFGGGDGWLAPGEGGHTFLGTGNNERGLAYGNGHVYLVSRTGGTNVRILNPTTGADLGGLNVTGVSRRNVYSQRCGRRGDGAIYAANLTTQSTTSPFTIYKWATEGSVPTVAYSGDGGLAGSRLGDDLAITGSGSEPNGRRIQQLACGSRQQRLLDHRRRYRQHRDCDRLRGHATERG